MAATRASGTNAVRYGTMRENVLSLEVVLPDGEVVQTSRRARKSAAGYDLTRLFVGSEGTLGVITRVTVRLFGVPEAIAAAVVPFPDMKSAVDAVILTIQTGIPVARIELLDEVQLDAVNRHSKLDYAVQPTLFLEFNGSRTGVEDQAKEFEAIARDHGGGEFRWATAAGGADPPLACAPRGVLRRQGAPPRLRGMGDRRLRADLTARRLYPRDPAGPRQDSFLVAPLVGHVGDGNFHLVYLIDPGKPDELREAQRLNDRLVERALAMDGTCTGEHGIGIGKLKYMRAEHGEAVTAMRAIKRALDPDGIMNPGKLIT